MEITRLDITIRVSDIHFELLFDFLNSRYHIETDQDEDGDIIEVVLDSVEQATILEEELEEFKAEQQWMH